MFKIRTWVDPTQYSGYNRSLGNAFDSGHGHKRRRHKYLLIVPCQPLVLLNHSAREFYHYCERNERGVVSFVLSNFTCWHRYLLIFPQCIFYYTLLLRRYWLLSHCLPLPNLCVPRQWTRGQMSLVLAMALDLATRLLLFSSAQVTPNAF